MATSPTRTRVLRWKAPTGRWLEPGHTFEARGRHGTFRFRAFVDGPDPHVEAVDADGRLRAIRPETIHTVSIAPVEVR